MESSQMPGVPNVCEERASVLAPAVETCWQVGRAMPKRRQSWRGAFRPRPVPVALLQ